MSEEPLIPELRFPEFGEEWFEKPLSELLTFKNGLNASKEAYGSGYKFINVLDIIQNDYITHDRIIGSVNVTEDEFKKNLVEFGDILFQRSSETREEVGQANVYLDNEKPASFGGFVIRGKRISDYDPLFMNSLLKTPRSRKEITSKSGGSTRYNVGQETLSQVVILTTIIEEQQKIASFLSAIDTHIQLLQKKKEQLELYKKGLMQQIFNQDVRFKDDDGNDFPDWEKKQLGDIFEIIGGGTPETTKEEYWSGNIPWFTPTEIKTKYLDKSNRSISELGLSKSSAKKLPIGTLLFTSRATIGECGIAIIECSTNQGFQSFLPNDDQEIEYLYYWIKHNRKAFIRKSSGSTFMEISKSEVQKNQNQYSFY